MKIKLKGFTLVELVVVMALISILMLAIMKMFQPIRSVYVDTTQYEAQRTSQNGVIQYLTESVRFASDMGIYNNTTNAEDAANAFAAAYCDAYGYNDADSDNITKIKNHVEIIVIDNKTTHTYGSKDYTGRLIRRKVGDGTSFPSDEPALTSAATSDWRIALGEAYYGANTYNITLDTSDSTNGMLTVNVASTRNGKRDISNAGNENTITGQITKSGVLCRNLTTNNGVANAGIFDVGYVADNTKNTYIIFVNKAGKDAIEAEGLTTAP